MEKEGTTIKLPKGAAQKQFWENKRREKEELARQQEIKELEASGLLEQPVITETYTPPVQEFKKEVTKEKTKMELSIDPSKKYRFELIEKSNAKRNVIIGTTNKIFDIEQGRPREITYIPIAPSIFVDELEGFMNVTPPYVGFNNNYLSVNGTDVRLIEYLMAHDDIESNPKRLSKKPPMFRLIDKMLIEKVKTDAYNAIDEVSASIKERDADSLRPVARIMFEINEPETKEGDIALRNRLRDLYRHSDINQAAANAKIILDNLTNPKFERQYLLMKGFDKGVIKLMPEHNCVSWNASDKVICQVRNIKDQNKTAGEMAEWSFLDENGIKFWEVFSKKV